VYVLRCYSQDLGPPVVIIITVVVTWHEATLGHTLACLHFIVLTQYFKDHLVFVFFHKLFPVSALANLLGPTQEIG
jgi:uncharacterized membrane protein